MIYCDLLGVLVQQTGRDGISRMPWARDARKLWDYLKHDNPIILAQVRMNEFQDLYVEHREWINRELGPTVRLYCVTDDVAKAITCSLGDVLIDDNVEQRGPWLRAGGIFIPHTTVDKTIELLARRAQGEHD